MSGSGGQFALVGIGETPVGKLPDRTALSLRLEASVAAMRDAGIEKQEIDGIITTQMRSNPQPNYSALIGGTPGNYARLCHRYQSWRRRCGKHDRQRRCDHRVRTLLDGAVRKR